MALFNIPKRQMISTQAIVKKTQEIQEPKIKLRGGTLLNKLASIEAQVKANLGDLVDKYLYIDTDERWLEYCRKACKAQYISLDTETSHLDNMLASLAGVCIMSDNQESAYVPIGHISNITEELLPRQVSKEAIGKGLQMLVDHNAKFIMHNGYFDIVELYQQCGIKLICYFDTLIGAALLNENEEHGLKKLYDKYVAEGKAGAHTFAELFEGIPIININPKIAGIYGQNDALETMELFRWMLPYLTKGTPECSEYKLENISDLFWNMDMPMLDVLVDMKLKGIEFDFEQAQKLKEKYTKLKQESLDKFNNSTMKFEDDIRIYNSSHPNDQIEIPVNYNSPKQLKALFYDIAGVPVGLYKKSPTGTGKDVVEAILHSESLKKLPIYEVVQNLSEVKMYDKAISTFIDKLTEDARIHKGKIHCDLILTATDTGRLASRNPNMQQCPSKLGDIRTMFTAGHGNVFINCDFSKQEPCLLCSASKDPKMIKVFEDGLDIYSAIAHMIYPEYTYEDCLEHYPDGTTNHEGKKRRSTAKKVVLSIMYSKGLKSLAEDLHCSVEKSQEIFNSVLSAYPVMSQWMKDTIAKAYKDGYVDNFFGRRRRLPSLLKSDFEFIFPKGLDEHTTKYYRNLYLSRLKDLWKNEDINKVISEAKSKGIIIISNKKQKADDHRKIVNFCIQGGAACVTKRAMLNIAKNKRLKELGAYMVLSIHDESMCVVPEEHAYEASKIIEECSIAGGEGLAVKLSCDIAITKNWYGQEYTFDENHKLIPLE